MKLQTLTSRITTPIFTQKQVQRVFSTEKPQQISIQLGRFENQGYIIRLRRGLYQIANRPTDEMSIAAWLYQPSYISLESALNQYGIIPDVPQQVTSVSPTNTKHYVTPLGTFIFAKIKPTLFFGYTSVQNEQTGLAYNLAEPAKAVLDYLYLRHITDVSEARLELRSVSKSRLRTLSHQFPKWVQRVISSEEWQKL